MNSVDDDDGNVLIQDMDNRNAFISKVALVFCVYFGIAMLFTDYINNNVENAREQYLHARLESSFSFYFILFIACKIIFSLLGKVVKKLAEVTLIVDFYLTYMTTLGLFFYLSNNKTYYSNSS